MAILSDMLVYLRKRAGLTQQELADKTNLKRSAIGMYETGRREPDLETLEIFADFYNVDMNTLTGKGTFSPTFEQVTVTDDVVTFRVHTDIAAGYDQPAEPVSDWEGATIEIPNSYLRGRPQSDYFLIRIVGNSMYPHYQDGDYVLVLRQETITRSGEIAVLLYNGGEGTLKKIEYGEDCIKLIPLNPEYEPKTIAGADMELCRVIGVPRMVIRDLSE